MNWKAVSYDLSEAREELERLEHLIVDPKRRNAVALKEGLTHAYLHVNFAWNVQRVSMSRYAHMTKDDSNRWGRFPSDLQIPRIPRSGAHSP